MITAGDRNDKVFNEVKALIDRLAYGSLDVTFDIHGKRTTELTVYGKKRNVYSRENQIQAYEDIIKRIKQAGDNKENSKLTFVVEIKKGQIQDVTWLSQLRRNYEELDKSL
ncbi:MAG: hypothetical protein ACM3SR_11395 [Ignavibacteriales bacterium]